MKKSKGKKWWIILLVVALGMVATIMGLDRGILVSSYLVDFGEVAQVVEGTGLIESEGTVLLEAKGMIDVKDVYVKLGDYVQKGELLLSGKEGTVEYDISALQAQASGIGAQLSNANTLASKNKTLYESGAISLLEYNQSKTVVAQLRSQLSSLNFTIQGLKEGTDASRITSPIAGYITEWEARKGEILQGGMTVAEISPLEVFTVKIQMLAQEAKKIQMGDQVILSQKDEVITEEGQVIRVAQKAREVISSIGIPQKRVEVIVSMPSSITGLILGDNLEASILTDQRKNALRVPDNAVFELAGKKMVYRIVEGKSRMSRIKVGLEGKDWIEVLEGLKKGDKVILSPGNDIKEGQKVKMEE